MYPTISMRELESWIAGSRQMYLVDLRSRWSFSRGHLLGAVNIPYEELEDRAEELPRDMPVVFYCQRGSKSLLACNQLWQLGYQVVNTGGGLIAYRGMYWVR